MDFGVPTFRQIKEFAPHLEECLILFYCLYFVCIFGCAFIWALLDIVMGRVQTGRVWVDFIVENWLQL